MPSIELLDAALESDGTSLIDAALATVRDHFGMPVAYLSRFEGEEIVFRNVSAPGLEDLIKPNDRYKLKETFCPRILKGELPNLNPDTAIATGCHGLSTPSKAPVGSYISLPVHLEDGSPYGMFCCLSPEPNPSLNQRDLAVMSMYLDLVTRQVQMEERARRSASLDKQEMEAILKARAFSAAFQPLVALPERNVVGAEALIRFAPPFTEDTEAIFTRASRVGLGIALERAAIANALRMLPQLGQVQYVSLNASVDLICHSQFDDLLADAPADRLVIEVTERDSTRNPDLLKSRVGMLKDKGIQIAIDDVGAGYSDLKRIMHLDPNLLKIDRSLISSLDSDATKRAAVAALGYFARETGTKILAEGVETEAEAACLQSLGVSLAQGWLFGRPASAEAFGSLQPLSA